MRLQGSQACQKVTFTFLQMKLFPFALRLPPKDTNFKIEEKMSKKACFLRLFRIFFNFGAILVHQTSNGVFSGFWPFFWRPWGLWGLIHVEDISNNSKRKVWSHLCWFIAKSSPKGFSASKFGGFFGGFFGSIFEGIFLGWILCLYC